jgi:hypothetical protein
VALAIAPPTVAVGAPPGVGGVTDRPGRREFVEVGRAQGATPVAASTTPAPDAGSDMGDAAPVSPAIPASAAEPGWNLWGDLEA